MFEKAKYVLLGFIAAILIISLLGAANPGGVGKYQISAYGNSAQGYGCYLLNTQTGAIKQYNTAYDKQNATAPDF